MLVPYELERPASCDELPKPVDRIVVDRLVTMASAPREITPSSCDSIDATSRISGAGAAAAHSVYEAVVTEVAEPENGESRAVDRLPWGTALRRRAPAFPRVSGDVRGLRRGR
jgi:hypothetical protein